MLVGDIASIHLSIQYDLPMRGVAADIREQPKTHVVDSLLHWNNMTLHASSSTQQ